MNNWQTECSIKQIDSAYLAYDTKCTNGQLTKYLVLNK